MITLKRRSALSPPVIRQFDFSRFHNQAFALAYQALIPVVARRLEWPRSRSHDNGPATITSQGRRSKSRGA